MQDFQIILKNYIEAGFLKCIGEMRIKLDELTIKYRAKERSKIIQLMALETIKIKLNRWKAFQRAA